MEVQEALDVQLGRDYKDEVTGFIGTATAFMESLHEPVQVFLENTDGARWFSLTRVTLTDEHAV